MKIVCTSDFHENFVDFLPKGDVLCIAGDLCLQARKALTKQRKVVFTDFRQWCEKQLAAKQYKKIIWIAGNHDVFLENLFQEKEELDFHPDIVYLRDSGYEFEGVKFWGTPWTSPFCDWGFNAKDEKRDHYFSKIPEGIDVLLSHAPPVAGGLGLTAGKEITGFDQVEAGDSVLEAHIWRSQPRFCICGHIHENGGKSVFIGKTEAFNCSLVDFRYRVKENTFQVIEIDK